MLFIFWLVVVLFIVLLILPCRTLNTVAKSQVNISSNIEQILFYLDEMRKLSKNSNCKYYLPYLFYLTLYFFAFQFLLKIL